VGDYDVVVVGGGPAGIMAAIKASENGRQVLLCESQDQFGRKLLASGGGRCNITNSLPLHQFTASFGPEASSFVKSCLKKFSRDDLLNFFSTFNISFVSKDGIHLFPVTNRSSDISDSLLKTCKNNGVDLHKGAFVEEIIIDGNRFSGVKIRGKIVNAKRCILACGGKSYPALGGSESGYNLAKGCGHTIVEPVPALVALVTEERWPGECAGLTLQWAGLTLPQEKDVKLKIRYQGGFLFTHNGISGPSVLDISASVSRLLIDKKSVILRCVFQNESNETEWFKRFEIWQQKEGSIKITSLISRYLPARLVSGILKHCNLDQSIRAADFNRASKIRIVQALVSGVDLKIISTEGWDRAMVTSGGVSLDNINKETLESKIIQGLFFAGEIINCQGPCGGFNLTWCFSSGAVAGIEACR